MAQLNYTLAPNQLFPTTPLKPLGVKTIAPEQNLKPTKHIIPSNQINTTTPIAPKTSLPSLATSKPATIPAPTLQQQATLYGPSGQKQVVGVGTSQASQLQSQGYGLTPGSYKAPTTASVAPTTPLPEFGKTIGSGGAQIDQTKPIDTSYGGLINKAAQTSLTGSPYATEAERRVIDVGSTNLGLTGPAVEQYSKAVQDVKSLDTEYAQQKAALSSAPMSLEFKQGREQVLDQLYAQKKNALQNAVNQYQTAVDQGITGAATQISGLSAGGGMANTAQGLTQSGLGTAIGAAAPIQQPYSNQLVNPQTGQSYGGGVGGTLQQTVTDVAQRVQSGNMTYADAQNAIGAYGQAGTNALLQALGPNFNVNQSNVLAQQQATIKPAYDFAKTALTRVQETIKNLGMLQGTNMPGANSISNWLSTTFGIGSQQTREYTQAVNEARNAYQQLLASSKGGTPTDYSGQANAAIPDNATPNDIQAAINSLESLGKAKVDIYGGAGGGKATTRMGGWESAKTVDDVWK